MNSDRVPPQFHIDDDKRQLTKIRPRRVSLVLYKRKGGVGLREVTYSQFHIGFGHPIGDLLVQNCVVTPKMGAKSRVDLQTD